MLGFSTYSEATYAQANPTVAPFVVLAAVTSVASVSSIDFIAEANITTGSVTSTTGLSEFAAVGAKSRAFITGVEFEINNYGFADEDAQATVVLPSATATFDLGIGFDAESNTGVSGVDLVTFVSGISTVAKASAYLSGVELGLNSTEVEVGRNTELTLGGVSALLQVGAVGTSDTTFNYAPFAEDYSRARTFYTVVQDNNNVVHVAPENYTVYIGAMDSRDTVYIAA